ncbi:hypothetical protein EB796_015407 [Bugula neritina]|uniref:Uncharacterized protein n=1 Tax=Bugula neritina TaxID=10212 RepID=A0A7J7JIX9_BUGNE|nr:hypothetical protein EB796_015407 [Bugula neritina]
MILEYLLLFTNRAKGQLLKIPGSLGAPMHQFSIHVIYAAQVDDRSSVASRAANSSAFSASQPNDGSFMTSRTSSTLSHFSMAQADDGRSVASRTANSSALSAWQPNDGSFITSRTSSTLSHFSTAQADDGSSVASRTANSSALSAWQPNDATQVNSISSSASPIPNFISATESQYNRAESSYRLLTNTSNIWSTNLSSGRGRDSNNSQSNTSANHSLESVNLHGHSIDVTNQNEGAELTQGIGTEQGV